MDKNMVSGTGYDLYEVTPNEWIFHVKNGPIYAGTFKKVVEHAVYRLRFNIKEFDKALDMMLSKNHNGAHFSMGKAFVFSFQKEFKYEQAS